MTVIFNKQLLFFIFNLENRFDLYGLIFKISLFSLIPIILTVALLPFYILNFTKLGTLMLLFIASAASYFMDSYGVIYDQSVIQSLFETSSAEAIQYLNVWHAIHISLFSFCLPIFLSRVRLKKDSARIRRKYLLKTLLNIFLILMVSTLLFYKDYASLFRNNRHLRHMVNPISPIYETVKLANHKLFPKHQKFMDLTKGIHRSPHQRRQVFVFVLGETARADHLQINGYSKNTNPLLSQQKILSFKNVQSCGTATATSVPCIFSGLGRKNFDQSIFEDRSNLLDLIQASGFKTSWVDNNTGCKGVCERTQVLDLAKLMTTELCSSQTCYDEILLNGLKQVSKSEGDLFIVLHMLGSHGPSYYKRYPQKFRQFSPECVTSDLSRCSKEQIINSYDNTLLYTDYVLNELIDYLKNVHTNADTALMYVSDHGESLGENGVYLHSLPYVLAPEAQKHVPLLLWMSDGYQQRLLSKGINFNQNLKCSLSHDHIFHTLLSALEIESPLHDDKLDITRLNPKECLAEK